MWKKLSADSDVYLWLNGYGKAIVTGVVFKKIDPYITSHDVMEKSLLETIDKGYIYKQLTCYDAETGYCPTFISPFGDLISLPATLFFAYKRGDVYCMLAKSRIFSPLGNNQYIYLYGLTTEN